MEVIVAIVAIVVVVVVMMVMKPKIETGDGRRRRKWRYDTRPNNQPLANGSGQSNGVINEIVLLRIYPKDDTDQVNPGELEVKVITTETAGGEQTLSTLRTFLRITQGWSCQYTRPSTLGVYKIRVGFPSDFLSFDCQVTAEASIIGPRSVLKVTGTCRGILLKIHGLATTPTKTPSM